MPDPTNIAIRSFRVVFKLERRIHKIDRWRIPLPFGVPLRGVGYAAALLVAALIGGRIPIVGDLLHAMPAPLRFAVLPVGGAYLLNQWELDGRPAHATALAWLRLRIAPRRLAAFRPAAHEGVVRLAELAIVPDERCARLRRAIVHGPAEVVLRYPFHANARGRVLRVTAQDGPARWRGKQVRLRPDQRIVIR
jgi:hypothetical protein